MKNKGLKDSFYNAWQGVRHAVTHERNFKLHVFAAIAVILLCIVLQVEAIHFLLVVFAIFSVLCMELVNTAVEALTDLFCGNKLHPLAKIAKDTAAAAVFLAAAQAVAVGIGVALSVIGRYIG